eukprot:535380_1
MQQQQSILYLLTLVLYFFCANAEIEKHHIPEWIEIIMYATAIFVIFIILICYLHSYNTSLKEGKVILKLMHEGQEEFTLSPGFTSTTQLQDTEYIQMNDNGNNIKNNKIEKQNPETIEIAIEISWLKTMHHVLDYLNSIIFMIVFEYITQHKLTSVIGFIYILFFIFKSIGFFWRLFRQIIYDIHTLPHRFNLFYINVMFIKSLYKLLVSSETLHESFTFITVILSLTTTFFILINDAFPNTLKITTITKMIISASLV